MNAKDGNNPVQWAQEVWGGWMFDDMRQEVVRVWPSGRSMRARWRSPSGGKGNVRLAVTVTMAVPVSGDTSMVVFNTPDGSREVTIRRIADDADDTLVGDLEMQI